MRRKGLGKGKGMGYKNLAGMDSRIHSQSAKGIKQPQKIGVFAGISKPSVVEQYNKTKDKSLLKNKGMAQENVLFKRDKLKIGTMKNYRGANVPINLEIQIKEKDLSTQAIYNGEGELLRIGNKKRTIDNEEVSSYRTLSISGNIGNEQAGQINDTLRQGLNDPDFDFKNKEAVKEILDIWDKHHLNDLKAGTRKQETALKNWKERPSGSSYSEDVEYLKSKKIYNDNGYKYGSAWLVGDIPKDIIGKLDQAIKRL